MSDSWESVMKTDRYKFRIGSFSCIAIHDFQATYAAESFFTNVPARELAPVLSSHGIDSQMPSPYPCLYIDTGSHRVLIDTGVGSGVHPVRGRYEGRMLSVLESEGVEPKDVDTVILTHGHGDHIGGSVSESRLPVFGNARHVLYKKEWDFWTGNPDLSRLTMPYPVKQALIEVAQEKLESLAGNLDLIEGEREVVPGVFAVEAQGHTPGHMVVLVSSDGERLLYISDTVLHPLHLEHPDWRTDYFDLDPEQAAVSKQRIVGLAASECVLVLAFHFCPFPSLGHVTAYREGWRWEPVVMIA